MKFGKKNVVFPSLIICALAFLNVSVDNAFADVSVSTPASATVSADTFGVNSTLLTGPVIDEGANQDIGVGTIVLNAPAGFQFDTRSNVVATVSRLDGGTGSLLALNPVITVTASNITLSATAADQIDGITLSRITFSGINVQPTAGSPLATGSITVTASPPIPGFTDGNVSASTQWCSAGQLFFGLEARLCQ